MEPAKTILAEGKFLRLVRDGRWEYADRTRAQGAVVLVAVTDDNRLVLTEQYRIPLGQRVLELPAGLVGDIQGEEDEPLVTAADRELLEETGYQAGRWSWAWLQGRPPPGRPLKLRHSIAAGISPRSAPAVAKGAKTSPCMRFRCPRSKNGWPNDRGRGSPSTPRYSPDCTLSAAIQPAAMVEVIHQGLPQVAASIQ